MPKLPFGRPSAVALVSLVLATFMPALRAENAVAVYSFAKPDYIKKRTVDGKLTPQTYVFMEGRFFGGTIRDPILERTPFTDIAKRLAVELRQQQFFPAKTIPSADLMLVVHWGVTAPRVHQQPARDLDSRTTNNVQYADPSSPHEQIGQAKVEEINSSGSSPITDWARLDAENPYSAFTENLQNDLSAYALYNLQSEVVLQNIAGTLGIADALRKESQKAFRTEYLRTLQTMLDEERYFIVVVAYDAKTLFLQKKVDRQWIARLSIRSPGVNFTSGVARMSQIGGQFFGKTNENVQLHPVNTKIKEGKVEIGEMIVIASDTK
jgi:hypothetical protein